MKAGNGPKAANARIRQQQQAAGQSQSDGEEGSESAKRGFRRRIQFRQAGAAGDGRVGGGAGRDEALARATALDDAQVALESFYAAFPVVPLLSVPHAKVRPYVLELCAVP